MLVPEVNVQSVFRYWGDSVVLENGEATGIAPLRKPQSLHELTSYLCAGTIAGAASRTGTAPLERLKVIYQIHTGGKPPSMYTVLSNIYKVILFDFVEIKIDFDQFIDFVCFIEINIDFMN